LFNGRIIRPKIFNPVEKTLQPIAEAERELGASFPASYKAAMKRHNGGEIPTEMDLWELYPLPGPGAAGKAHQPSGDLVQETLERRSWPGFPEGAVALADNGLGDQLIMLREGDQFGPALYFWHHESAKLEWLAADFADLEQVP